jgi:hypothetical protein
LKQHSANSWLFIDTLQGIKSSSVLLCSMRKNAEGRLLFLFVKKKNHHIIFANEDKQQYFGMAHKNLP